MDKLPQEGEGKAKEKGTILGSEKLSSRKLVKKRTIHAMYLARDKDSM